MRPLAEKARDELGLTEVLRQAGIEGWNAHKAVDRWLEGWLNRKRVRCYRRLPDPIGQTLRDYLRDKYPAEFKQASDEEASRRFERFELVGELVRHAQEALSLEERLKELEKKAGGEPPLGGQTQLDEGRSPNSEGGQRSVDRASPSPERRPYGAACRGCRSLRRLEPISLPQPHQGLVEEGLRRSNIAACRHRPRRMAEEMLGEE